MSYLTQVIYRLPNTNKEFTELFLKYLSPLGTVTNKQIELEISDKDFLPTTSIEFTNVHIPQVIFLIDDKSIFNVGLINTTNVIKNSPHTYSSISLETFIKRLTPYDLKYIDHTGFNLPYFEGIHPVILDLREKLKNACLYHKFPKHIQEAPWDFIIPGLPNEISSNIDTDYSLVRRPKIEIVSFDKSSTPLIQLDIQIDAEYENLVKLFPEAIHVDEIKNIWVYIQNDFGIDICFVLNKATYKDWSFVFAKDRLL